MRRGRRSDGLRRSAIARPQHLTRAHVAAAPGRLSEAGAIAREGLEFGGDGVKNAKSAFRAAEFAVAAAEQELRLAGARLEAPPPAGRAVEVVAPVDGVVLKRLHESESVVPAGEPLVEIGDPQRLEIVADLLSTDAVRV